MRKVEHVKDLKTNEFYLFYQTKDGKIDNQLVGRLKSEKDGNCRLISFRGSDASNASRKFNLYSVYHLSEAEQENFRWQV